MRPNEIWLVNILDTFLVNKAFWIHFSLKNFFDTFLLKKHFLDTCLLKKITFWAIPLALFNLEMYPKSFF